MKNKGINIPRARIKAYAPVIYTPKGAGARPGPTTLHNATRGYLNRVRHQAGKNDPRKIKILDFESLEIVVDAAETISKYLIGNAILASLYWAQVEKPPEAIAPGSDWAQEVIANMESGYVTREWIEFSLSQRSRPV